MSGYLTNKSDYFQGEYTRFGINQAVAKAGGTQAHIKLLTFLISSSFPTYNLITNKSCIFFDNRAAQSMLFLFEPRVQILFSALLYKEDILIQQHLEDLENVYYKSHYNIPSILEVIDLSKNITKINFGRTILNILDNPFGTKWENELKFILCIKSKDKLFHPDDIAIEQRIRRLIKVVNITSPYLEHFIDVAKTNNRIQASALIGERLGYNQACIQSIATTIERWLLSSI